MGPSFIQKYFFALDTELLFSCREQKGYKSIENLQVQELNEELEHLHAP